MLDLDEQTRLALRNALMIASGVAWISRTIYRLWRRRQRRAKLPAPARALPQRATAS